MYVHCTPLGDYGQMNYEWNPVKAATNLIKHGVRFADAVLVFEDEQAITRKERILYENGI